MFRAQLRVPSIWSARRGVAGENNLGLLGYLQSYSHEHEFPVNLATQPSRKDRPILVASGAVGVLLVATLVLLVSLALADRAAPPTPAA